MGEPSLATLTLVHGEPVTKCSDAENTSKPFAIEKRARKKGRVLFYATGFISVASAGVYLAETPKECFEEWECYTGDEFDSPQYDDLIYSNWKKGCHFCRSTSRNGKPKVKPHHKIKTDVTMKRRVHLNGNRQDRGLCFKKRAPSITPVSKSQRSVKSNSKSKVTAVTPRKPHRKPKSRDNPAALKHELREDNSANPGADSDLVRGLIALQHRDLTPEDYELLLRLDEGVAPKTVSKSILDSILVVTVDVAAVIGQLCTICMELYEAAQMVKTLPCKHTFHADCIDQWLSKASQNCPLDGHTIEA